MVHGKVKRFDNEKGNGVIITDAGVDVSFRLPPHVFSSARNGPKYVEGQAVEFDIVEGPKGPQAKNVKKV